MMKSTMKSRNMSTGINTGKYNMPPEGKSHIKRVGNIDMDKVKSYQTSFQIGKQKMPGMTGMAKPGSSPGLSKKTVNA